MASRSSRNLPLCLLLAGLALGGLSGCVVERETTLSRAARQREVQAMRVARERLESELEILVRRSGELGHEIAVARANSVRTEASLRATLADLDHRLGKLMTAEQDLAAARERAEAIELELKPLRDLEQTLRQQEELRVAAEQRVEALRAEVAAAEADAARVTAELAPRLDSLREQLKHAEGVEKALGDAGAALQAAARILSPPPAPSPAVPPAPSTAAPPAPSTGPTKQ